MAEITGLAGDGYVALGTPSDVIGKINSFSTSESRGEDDVTTFNEDGSPVDAYEYKPGLYDATIDMSGFLSWSDAKQENLRGNIRGSGDTFLDCYLHNKADDTYYYASIFVTGRDVGKEVDGVSSLDLSNRVVGKIQEASEL